MALANNPSSDSVTDNMNMFSEFNIIELHHFDVWESNAIRNENALCNVYSAYPCSMCI